MKNILSCNTFLHNSILDNNEKLFNEIPKILMIYYCINASREERDPYITTVWIGYIRDFARNKFMRIIMTV